MTAAMPILAAGGDDPTVKIVIGVAVAVFWIIAQIAGAVGKKPDKKLPPEMPKRLPPQERPPQRQPQANRQPPPVRRQKPQPQRRQTPPLRVPQAQTFQPAPATRSRLAESVAETQRAVEKAAAAVPKALPRRAVINALLQPRNLKRAFIVNELLQPPVALRRDRE